MANTSLNIPLLLLLLLSAMYIVAAQQSISNITQSSFLTPTGKSSWLSPSGLFAFGFYPQGYNSFRVGIFLAGFPMKKTVVWTANRDDPPVSDDVTLRLTEGKLILQRKSQTSNVLTHVQSISTAYMLDSGNFVVYDSNRKIIWQSFDHPTDTILPGQSLLEDQELFSSKTEYDSSTGKFRLKLQIDSNLVQYPVDTLDNALYAYWASDTAGKGVMTLKLYSGGNLLLLNNLTTVLKNITASDATGLSEKHIFYLMKIDSDGIFRVYSYSLDNRGNSPSVVWASSHDKCDPKGTCGPNSYCALKPGNYIRCECPWGFRYTSPGNWTGGCDMNYTADSGKNKEEQRTQYNMTTLHGIVWGNEPYPVEKMKSKEECKEACWQDHNCEAAFFIDEMCSKVRLPLRYGRYSSSNSLTYVKWALPPPKMTKNEEDHQSFILVLLVGIGAGFVALLILLFVSYWGVRKRQSIKLKENYFKQNGGIMLQQLLYKSVSIFEKAKIYTEEELKKATKNFSESNVIGQGGYGTVYKGVLADTVLAIKKSKVLDRSQLDQFVNEVIILSQIEHHNVVKLLGCCLETPVPLLVSEFVTNKTLFYHIHGEGCASSISWNMRLRIATETASALAHMHSASVHIIHRDIKSANILLDDEYTAKVSDFGISRLFSPEETHLATLVQGTFGYIDPEYFHSGILTQKSDVYSFGVVLVELLTGANVVSFEREEKERNLVMYFLSAMEDDRLHDILEPCVEKEGHAEQLIRVAMLAERCLRIEGHKRPTMREVRDELEFLILKEVDRANLEICV